MTFAIYKHPLYPVVGLAAEVGEFSSKLSKHLRRDSRIGEDMPWAALTDDQRDDLLDELGDVLWMLTACATELDLTLDCIAEANIDKLMDRKIRGVIDGSGDKR